MRTYYELLTRVLHPMQAITVYDQALTLFHDLPYRDFSVVAEAYSRLGAIFEEKDNIEASLHAWKEALKISSIKLGNDSIAVAGILYHIGLLYVQLGNYDKSTKCLSESVKIFRSQTEGDSMVAVSLGFIGKNYMRKKQYAKAVEVSTESLRLKKQHARAEDVAESLVDLGNILKAWGKSDQAIQFFDEALRTYTEALGFDSVEVASCKHSIGLLKKSVGDTDAALRCFGESLQVYRRKEGDKSLNVADNLFQIGQIYESFGNKDKSMMCFEECLKVRKEILGDDHLEVLAAQRFVVKQLKYYK
jgi:tetratricopeptide (TPR) repeat protein